tara:strand:- start:239 stop:364 length:126 start_codon:yes stop_codon:yes gene_type:complete
MGGVILPAEPRLCASEITTLRQKFMDEFFHYIQSENGQFLH